MGDWKEVALYGVLFLVVTAVMLAVMFGVPLAMLYAAVKIVRLAWAP